MISYTTEIESFTNMDIYMHEERIFQETCEIIKEYKRNHPSVSYAVTIERSSTFDPKENRNEETTPKHYSSDILIYLYRDGGILELHEGAGEWPGVVFEAIKVKSFFGKNKKLLIGIDYRDGLLEDLEWTTSEYERDYDTYFLNEEESKSILSRAANVAIIE